MADTIQPYVGTRVLEIGAGIGNLSQFLAARRKSYTASDIDEEHLARLRARLHRPNLSLIRCDLSAPRISRRRGQRRYRHLPERAEHIEDDAVGLRNIARAVPGEWRIVLVPQDQSIYGTLDEVLGHYRRYSEAELRKKMEAAGFQVDRVLHFNRVTRPGWWFNGRVLKRRHFSRFQLWWFDRMVWLWRRIDRLTLARGLHHRYRPKEVTAQLQSLSSISTASTTSLARKSGEQLC